MRQIFNKHTAKGMLALTVFFLVIVTFYKCPVKMLTGYDCPGCGMTRAIISFFKFDFKKAFGYHCLFPVVVVGGGYYVLHFLFPEKVNIDRKAEQICLLVFFIMLITVWAVKRLIL